MLKRYPTLLTLLAACWLALPLAAAAQVPPVKPVKITFGKPEPADFEAKNFVADSAAAAVVLYDGGKTTFVLTTDNKFRLETERLTRIKILKKAGYEVATVEVPLYHKGTSDEKLTNLRGFTYTEAGGKLEKTKLDVGQTFTEETTKNVRLRKFTLPNVREGVVIEYAYTVTSDFLFNFQDWVFQREIPIRWSEFHATIPEYFTYKMLQGGYEPLALQTTEEATAQYMVHTAGSFNEGSAGLYSSAPVRNTASSDALTARTTSYYWAMRDVPALRREAYMTTPRDYVARINFELAGIRMPGEAYHNVAGTWDKINSDLLESEEFGQLLDRASFLAAAVQPLIAQYPDPAARAAAVRELVLHAIKYDGTNTYYASGPLKRSYDLHRGNSADVNLLLIAALRQANLPAQPVLLSTRTHGRVNQYSPLLDQFNYVIGVLPLPEGPELLLDATEPLLPCGMLPARCLNQVGRLVSAKGEADRWVDLKPAQRHSHYQEVKLAVDAEGNLTGKVSDEHGGYSGLRMREKLQELGEKKYVAELAGQHPGWELPSYTFSQVSAIGQPVRLSYELRQPASSAGQASELYLKPLEAFGEGKNPFTQAQRNYPVDFGAPTQDVIVLTLTLPAGYTAELPKPAVVDLPDQGGRYTYSATSPAPGTVQLLSRISLSKPVYGAEEYNALREFYRLVLSKQAEALVIKKP